MYRKNVEGIKIMDENLIYGRNAIIEALESGSREFNRILISNISRADEKI